MIRRKHLLVGLCGLGFVATVALRAREALDLSPPVSRSDFPAWHPESAGASAEAIARPRDYVRYPDVAAGEERRGPRRIVSLAPSITETLCALGLADRLVGRTQFCLYPPEVEPVTVVGGIQDTNLEMIRALEPDLVLTTSNSGGLDSKLQALGLPCEALPHESLEDVFAAIKRIGTLCDRPETARRLIAAIQADLDRLRANARASGGRPKRVLIVLSGMPVPPRAVWAAGPGLFLDVLLRAAGHHNAAAELMSSSHGEIPLERLVVLDPEVILTFPLAIPEPAETLKVYRAWEEVGEMTAIRERRIHPVGGPEWLSAGPRVAVELYRIMAVLNHK